MERKQCSQCGGSMERLRIQKAWLCPYCGARIVDAAQPGNPALEKYYGLNEEVFSIDETDLQKIMKKEGGAGCVRSIAYCMSAFEAAGQVEDYMLKKLHFSQDISMKGIREEQIDKALPMLNTVMDPGERVIMYENKGVFSKGKEYVAVTDKRCVFVSKATAKTVSHTDIDSLKIQACGNCYLNGDYDKGILSLDGNGKYQGAVITLICMFSFASDPDRTRINIIS